MSDEFENYIDFKIKTYAHLSVKDIPLIELRKFNSELSAYIDSKSSPKHAVTGEEQKQPPLNIDFDSNEKPRFFRDPLTRPRNCETKAILEFLRNKVDKFGQKFIISPSIVNMQNPDLKKFDIQITHISNSVYRKFFPNVAFSYRRLDPPEDHAYEITVGERRN